MKPLGWKTRCEEEPPRLLVQLMNQLHSNDSAMTSGPLSYRELYIQSARSKIAHATGQQAVAADYLVGLEVQNSCGKVLLDDLHELRRKLEHDYCGPAGACLIAVHPGYCSLPFGTPVNDATERKVTAPGPEYDAFVSTMHEFQQRCVLPFKDPSVSVYLLRKFGGLRYVMAKGTTPTSRS